MQNSKIEWTDHTFNAWEGCTKVSPGCAHCYAETRNARFGGGEAPNWGKGAPRRRTSPDNWKQPLKWDSAAETAMLRAGMDRALQPYVRPRVFCASLADWLDDEVPIAWLVDLLVLMHATPNLDWLLLTKRPQNFATRIREARAWMIGHLYAQTERGQSMIRVNPNLAAGLPLIGKPVDKLRSEYARYADALEMVCAWTCSDAENRDDEPPANVWIGTTVEDQQRADERIPILLTIPARVRFLSCEPLLGRVNLGLMGTVPKDIAPAAYTMTYQMIHWVICGGESGKDARPMNPDWARHLRSQCETFKVAFFFKQWGEWVRNADITFVHPASESRIVMYGDGDPRNFRRVYRVGKKAAGRLLDGIEHNAFPEAR